MTTRSFPVLLLCGSLVVLAGCSGAGEEELQQWMTDQRNQTRPRVEVLPEPTKFSPQAYTQEGAIERTLGEHALIVAALELRDPALVAARLTAHVSGVEDWVRRALLEDPVPR